MSSQSTCIDARRRLALLAAVALLGFAPQASAQRALEKLVMPGPVIRDHADVEGECGRCHQPFARSEQRNLCFACHEEIGRDLADGTGFHGLSPSVSGSECHLCHSEHRGRDFDAVGLDAESFDHQLTDFALRGRHEGAGCDACHAPGRKHREAPHDCVACHEEDDAHRGRLGTACADCHDEQGWSDTAFDHAKTDFPLVGRHREVGCALCHPDARYEDTPQDCLSCHRTDDVHRGRLGPDCARCHTARGFTPAAFDHARETGFALRGRHARARCESCHAEPIGRELPQDCAGCHRADDVHRGRNGSRCETCHAPDAWATLRFDHDSATRFPLRGAHREVRCESCHVQPADQVALETICRSCHAGDDPHAGQLGDACDGCHREQAWNADVFFDHDVTHFPLLGLHAVVACEQCHASARFADAASDCASCHATDDVHRGRLGSECARCHTPNGWRVWRFDHEETGFALRGAHADQSCESCHRQPVDGAPSLPTRCDACHAGDDRHAGAFGRDCGRCHVETAWDDVRNIR